MNAAMIRRRLRTPKLRFESMTVGKESRTQVALCYMEGKVDPTLLQKIRDKLQKIPLDDTLAAGFLTPFLHGSGIFSGVGLTERPDTVCGKIEEGRWPF